MSSNVAFKSDESIFELAGDIENTAGPSRLNERSHRQTAMMQRVTQVPPGLLCLAQPQQVPNQLQ